MVMKVYDKVEQGSDEWLELRRGILCASEVRHIMTPTLKVAKNDKVRTHTFELLAQRITGYVEPTYVSDDMLRGREDEIEARHEYSLHHAPVDEVGFITEDRWGFVIGYSPDGLVSDDGLIECKSRQPRHHVRTVVEDEVPEEHVLQLQTGLLVTGRKWIDYISRSAGLPLYVKRVYPDAEIQDAIIKAASEFYDNLNALETRYKQNVAAMKVLIPTERRIEQEMYIG